MNFKPYPKSFQNKPFCIRNGCVNKPCLAKI